MKIASYPLEESTNLIRPLLPVLVTTFSNEYGVNAAPMSAFSFLSYENSLVTVAVHPSRDTYKNIVETGELVANIPSEDMLDKLFECARKYPRGVNELEKAGLTGVSSCKVKPPRVAECVAWVEYIVNEELHPLDSDRSIFVCRPVAAAVRKDAIKCGRYSPEDSKILVHLSGNIFSSAEKTLLAGPKLRKERKVLNRKEYMEYITGKQIDGKAVTESASAATWEY